LLRKVIGQRAKVNPEVIWKGRIVDNHYMLSFPANFNLKGGEKGKEEEMIL
jgi:hypothetical protein